jgi:hypothetical protein
MAPTAPTGACGAGVWCGVVCVVRIKQTKLENQPMKGLLNLNSNYLLILISIIIFQNTS